MSGVASILRALSGRRTATEEARQLVLSIISSQQTPPTAHEIYKLAVQQEFAAKGEILQSPAKNAAAAKQHSTEPPYPTHIIRSMQHLKRVVLRSLVNSNDIQQVHKIEALPKEERAKRLHSLSRSGKKHADHTLAPVSIWRWQILTNKPVPPKPKEKPVFGKEVGVGQDWSHLNKRRQRSRIGSVRRDVRWLWELENAKTQSKKAVNVDANATVDATATATPTATP
ncbi:uncharacterized protein LAESUDRAFT_734900 [Laetiporus sulphureus 93-53]|uniref:Uncharacterized protein n=1 Tax=Laetiporus sulphureus 93-53 TaxID=1314785 RepID=A0A165GM90_9APHY|nr:uncharacterized protein LAESUDRAFT_734900 [Laetiporus sulphureus 93-53]KZT10545.1 hypothetical protein LAESUDRAFT_734900 [Laetiporus sulphureus 93-53]